MREFYAKSGISRGTLESNTGITEETISKFMALYPNISPQWLILGVGVQDISPYAQHDDQKHIEIVSEHVHSYGMRQCPECDLRERLLAAKDQTINSLQLLVDELRKKCP